VDVLGVFFPSCLCANCAEFQLQNVSSVLCIGIRVVCSLRRLCASENGTPVFVAYQLVLVMEIQVFVIQEITLVMRAVALAVGMLRPWRVRVKVGSLVPMVSWASR
jgi:hypothetical protein